MMKSNQTTEGSAAKKRRDEMKSMAERKQNISHKFKSYFESEFEVYTTWCVRLLALRSSKSLKIWNTPTAFHLFNYEKWATSRGHGRVIFYSFDVF